MSSSTVRRRVLGVDTYLWSEPIEGETKRRQRHSAERGDVIEISPAEADRGEAITGNDGIPALGPEDAEVPDTAQGFVPANDETIEAMTVAQVTAYLGTVPEDQHPDELDRVLELESLRDTPRTSVLALAPDFEGDPDDDPANDPAG